MNVEAESIPEVVFMARTTSQLSKVAFATAAGTTRAAIDEYEKGLRMPRVDSLIKILHAAEISLQIDEVRAAPTTDGTTLATFVNALDPADPQWSWRTLISDFTANEFAPALSGERRALLVDEPSTTTSQQWDCFVAALAEHLSYHARIDAPAWAFAPVRGPLDSYWWPVHGLLPSMRSAAWAYTPAAFRRRCIAIDGRELPVIAP